tara:strand:+ start:64 stop:552 length:489 start_codon:yes stop_codon:yes gene_type:complete
MAMMYYTPIEELPHPPAFLLSDYDVEDDLPILYQAHEAKMKVIDELKKTDINKLYFNLTRVSFTKYRHRDIGFYDKPKISKQDGRKYIYTLGNPYKKFIAVNLPINSSHKSSANDRFDIWNKDYTDRSSLLKAELYEWCKLNLLPVKKSTKVRDMVDMLRNM